MRKKFYMPILLFLVIGFFCVISNVFAYQTSDYPYTIDKYNIDVNVNEDNTLNITEKITANFFQYRHGIIRKIPLKNKIVREDGTTSNNRAKITDVFVNDIYSISNQFDSQSIRIGDPDVQRRDVKEYIIKYTYNLGEDKAQNCDELYFNLIGIEWDTTIRNVSFKITMPKEFDKSLLGFSIGLKGSAGTNDVYYNVNGNTITGSYNNILNPGCGLTVRLQLPDKYFVAQKQTVGALQLLVIILPILLTSIAFWFWYKYGRDKKVIPTVEFYPPEGFNSAEIGFFYKGKAEGEDIVSLLIYLANKGYIKISEYEEESLFGPTKKFKILKLKDYDGDNDIEKLFLNGLFKSKKKVSAESIKEYMSDPKNLENSEVTNGTAYEVDISDLNNKFYITLNKIKKIMNSKKNKEKIFTKISANKQIYYVLTIILILALTIIVPFAQFSDINDGISSLAFLGIGLLVVALMLKYAPILSKILGIMLGSGLSLMSIYGFIAPTLIIEPIYFVAFIIGLICVVILIILCNFIDQRTEYGNEILGKILGFKKFLETTQKDKLEELVNDNPTYFYDILPFTYVLEISDKWIKNFEDIALVAPDWYSGNSTFSTVAFGSFVRSTMYSASNAMTSSQSGSSSGGFSGGGSSGGGSGGGGGSSW